MRRIDHYIADRSENSSIRIANVWDPNTGQVQAEVVLGDAKDLERSVAAALSAQPGWSATNPQRRARVMFRFKELIEQNMDELAHLLSSEHGKVIADSRGDIQRGLEVVEFACGIPQALKGEYTYGAGPGIDVYSMRQPLGVVAGITPFNFPAMIPMWMFAVAIAVGNAFILKPSERDPSVPIRLAELLLEAGAPEGILQVVHGDKEMVDAILDHDAISAVSFVGSSDIAHYVYHRGVAAGKRIQAMGGAKNHGIVMPDADLDQVVQDLVGAAFGSAGERCMALPVVVPVGEVVATNLRQKLVPAIERLRVGVSTDKHAHYGPVVTAAHKAKIEGYIQQGVSEGAELVVDGRGFSLQGHEAGFFIGPTLFDHVKPEMLTYKEEIFGPVLQIVRATNFEEALRLPSEHAYGNGVAIFTRNGHAAREFAARANVGMVGINIPIPVPVAYHSFGGWKRSAFGDTNQHGMEGVRFFTKVKTVTRDPMRGERTINEAEAAVVRRIFRSYNEGKSSRTIALELNREGVPGPQGGEWGPSTIHGNPTRGTGIINNELYVGRLVWNRLRYLKDPATGKRVSRLNPEGEWVLQDVPELRIVDQDSWDAAKERQCSLALTATVAGNHGLNDRRRPKHLFSGLVRCGTCGGGFSMISKDLLGCSAARNKGTCENRLTIRRDALEASVAYALAMMLSGG
jgi:malonate-semialdehyde dehydrogenase (acetylating)/methylmalonate-semialdehyde dehydrogenase